MAKKFFFICGGILMLALAYHFGAGTATAQAPSNPVVAFVLGPGGGDNLAVVTANGDLYGAVYPTGPWALRSNVFAGGATPINTQTWGSVKVQAR